MPEQPEPAQPEQGCELCEAAHTTEWFHEDDLCWVAECEACDVAMVVWKQHDPDPPAEIRAELLHVLAAVAAQHYDVECWFDETMRSIPHHYHAHARPRGGFSGFGSRRRTAR